MKKKARAKQPTARSLEALRAQGYTAGVVERYNHHTRQKNDLYGFGDIVACKAGEGVVIVQTTVVASMAHRVAKVRAEPRAREWLDASPHNRIEVHGWGRYKAKRGGKAIRWKCRVAVIDRDSIHPAPQLTETVR